MVAELLADGINAGGGWLRSEWSDGTVQLYRLDHHSLYIEKYEPRDVWTVVDRKGPQDIERPTPAADPFTTLKSAKVAYLMLGSTR
jgi:hypothetical protein